MGFSLAPQKTVNYNNGEDWKNSESWRCGKIQSFPEFSILEPERIFQLSKDISWELKRELKCRHINLKVMTNRDILKPMCLYETLKENKYRWRRVVNQVSNLVLQNYQRKMIYEKRSYNSHWNSRKIECWEMLLSLLYFLSIAVSETMKTKIPFLFSTIRDFPVVVKF